MNSVGGHVVAALRPDPRIVHEIERTHSPERMVRRELAQYGVTKRPVAARHALGPCLTLCPAQISNGWRRCYSRPSTPSRNARKEDVLGRLLPTGHRLKIAAPVRKGTGLDWDSAFHGALGSAKLATHHSILDQGTHRPIHGLGRSTRESPISVTVVGISELITFTHAESTTLMAARGMYKKVA